MHPVHYFWIRFSKSALSEIMQSFLINVLKSISLFLSNSVSPVIPFNNSFFFKVWCKMDFHSGFTFVKMKKMSDLMLKKKKSGLME